MGVPFPSSSSSSSPSSSSSSIPFFFSFYFSLPPIFFLLYLVAQSCPTLCNRMDCCLPGSSVHGDSPGKNTGLGCHALLQGIFPTQGSNLGLLHWHMDSLPSEPPGKSLYTEVGSLSLLRGSSRLRNQTGVSFFAG